MVGDLVALVCGAICESDEELAARVGVEVLGSVAFNPGLAPDLGLFALSVYLFDHLVEVG